MAMVVVASLPLAFVLTKAFERGVHLRGLVRVMVLGASPPRVHWVPARLFACACVACIYSEGARKAHVSTTVLHTSLTFAYTFAYM